VRAALLEEQFKRYNRTIGGISVWAEDRLCSKAGNDLSQMLHNLSFCMNCSSHFLPMKCPVDPSNDGVFVREAYYLASVALLLLSSAFLGNYAANAANDPRKYVPQAKGRSKGSAASTVESAKNVSIVDSESISFEILAHGLLAKNKRVVLRTVDGLEEVKDQIRKQAGLEDVEDFDIIGMPSATKESTVVRDFASYCSENDGITLQLHDRHDFTSTDSNLRSSLDSYTTAQDNATDSDDEEDRQQQHVNSNSKRTFFSLGSQAQQSVIPLDTGAWHHTQDKTPSMFKGYFRRPNTTKKMLAVGVAAYNEECYTLKRTLESLQNGFSYKLDKKDFSPKDTAAGTEGGMVTGLGYYMSVLIMIDGKAVMSQSMGTYLGRIVLGEAG
jgi:hypothetical protein